MSNKFKEIIAAKAEEIVLAIYTQGKLIKWEVVKSGLFLDFDLPEPINKRVFEEIKKRLDEVRLEYSIELAGYSGVYEDGDSTKKMLQRLNITAFEDNSDWEQYKEALNEAMSRDHKVLGEKLKLFSHSDEIGQGLVLWNPKGAVIRRMLEQFSQNAHVLNDYQWVYTPHIGKAKLWKTSGHLESFSDTMYSPINVDGELYYLKPMNCPFHISIYNNEIHSYRDLPIKYVEFGTVYRYELSGTLSGMTRVRGFTQDDAHIICIPEQVEDEVIKALQFSLYILRSFGFQNFYAYVATRPEEKAIGSIEDWDKATETLIGILEKEEIPYEIDEGGGAFYGPKIDLKIKDSLEREWQCSTIQFDFNLPRRFNMSYIGNDGQKHTPCMIHRALFGAVERFTALLIEHYKGEFPFWFAPVQIGLVSIKEKHNEYVKKLATALKQKQFRVSANYQDIHMREKIKACRMEKLPYTFVIGDKEMEENSFAVQSRKNGNLGTMNLESFCEYVKEELDDGVPKYLG